MEENIKKLEQSLVTYGHDTIIVNKQAMQNVIKGYRENEERVESLLTDIYNNYIPKSKIKEKITEIGKEYAEDEIDCETYSFMKEILQELMEDK